jgi:hypothetical protein
MGVGLLAGWHPRWELLPLALEDTWGQMENLCARRVTSVQQIQEEITLLIAPKPDWNAFACYPHTLTMSASDVKVAALQNVLVRPAQALIVPLDGPVFEPQLDMIFNWHLRLKAETWTMPSTVFMGGIPEQSYLAVYNRALSTSDFVDLWSV